MRIQNSEVGNIVLHKQLTLLSLLRKKKKNETEKMLIASLVSLNINKYPDLSIEEVFSVIKYQSGDYS
jgi:hypothetical protein